MEEEAKIRKVFFNNSKNQRLVGILEECDKNKIIIIIICHGMTANKDCNFIPPLSEFLHKNNFSILRFDFTGNGESDGELSEGTYTQEVDDLGRAIDFSEGLGYKKIIVMGHSMGGAVAIIRACRDKRINLLVAIAAVAYPGRERLVEKQKKELSENGYTFYWGKYKINKKFFEDASKYDITKYVNKIKIPFLVIHGDKDIIVDPKEARDIYKNASQPKKLEMIKEAKHEFGYFGLYKNQEETKEFKVMKEAIIKFFEKWLG